MLTPTAWLFLLALAALAVLAVRDSRTDPVSRYRRYESESSCGCSACQPGDIHLHADIRSIHLWPESEAALHAPTESCHCVPEVVTEDAETGRPLSYKVVQHRALQLSREIV